MKELKDLKKLLQKKKRIVITTHRNPDGDAVGSSLGLYHFLSREGHKVHVIVPNEYGDFLQWLPGNDKVMFFDKDPEKAKEKFEKADLLFCLDFNNPARTEGMEDLINDFKKPKVLIDHHLDPEPFEDFRLWDTDACATAQLVYDFILFMDGKEKLDQDIASCLYTGIITDSGSFRYSSVTPKTHRAVAGLLETGIEHTLIHQYIFDSFKENNLRFFGYALANKLKVLKRFRTAFIALSREDILRYNIQRGQTEGLVNYPLSISGVVFAVLMKENDKEVKFSFRSKGDFPANEFAAKFFEGGGHQNAAGGRFTGKLEEAVERFERNLPEYEEKLNKV